MASVEMILTALQTGYGGADPESSGAYDELCALVRNAFADNSRALRALEEFLDDPGHERPLVKALSETGVDRTRAFAAAARASASALALRTSSTTSWSASKSAPVTGSRAGRAYPI
jgi:hypothetical protein